MGQFCPPPLPREHWAMSGDIFYHHDSGSGVTGIQWVEYRDAATHPTIHRTAPTTRITWPQMSIVPGLRTLVQYNDFGMILGNKPGPGIGE